MTASFKMACYIFMAGITLIGGACAPSATGKPEASAGAASRSPGGDQKAGEGQRKTGESDTDASSLKRLQEGKSSATAASSPLKDVFFEFDRYDLTSDARTTLRANADWMKGNSSTRVEIEGHCDERGTNEYNLALGAKRAQAAREFLSSLGIPADRLSTISYGEEIPVCKEASESCWRQNRRARFVIVQGRPTS
ncbi:MAG TPA: peptidoglycan-associated lipoprotein Pal [Candidatus Binatia bacterium]|jgi:peptidoglycan-associated lipoprotein